jgi:hypothetical protein
MSEFAGWYRDKRRNASLPSPADTPTSTWPATMCEPCAALRGTNREGAVPRKTAYASRLRAQSARATSASAEAGTLCPPPR